MKLVILPFVLFWMCFAQGVSDSMKGTQSSADTFDPHLAHKQREALIKEDHKKNLEDAAALLKLAEEMKADIEKDDPQIVSIRTIKKTEDIEKLAKNIRGRLKRF